MPWQQRGLAPALPIIGTSSAEWASGDVSGTILNANAPNSRSPQYSANSGSYDYMYVPDGIAQAHASAWLTGLLNDNTVDLSSATAFDVADLRFVVQIQRWLERNARSGARYTEFLRSHFGVSPHDSRLQRPEYIGGMKTPVIVSEVLQTSQSGTTPQGNMAGHGMSLGSDSADIVTGKQIGRAHV